MERALKIVCGLILVLHAEIATADSECFGLAKGPIVFDITSCKNIVPKEDFTQKANYSFFKGLPANEKAKFMSQYQGLLLHGQVVKSEAVHQGLDSKKGAIEGKKIKVFLPGGEMQCQMLQAKRINVALDEACCSGGVDAPCLLDTPYTVRNAQVLGEAGSAAGDKERTAIYQLPQFQSALKAHKEKKYKDAAKLFEELRSEDKLDVRGHFLLGLTYRNLDECKKAIPVLDVVSSRAAKKDVWADQEAIVRRANFLLARCYARTNDAGRATIILNSYLVDPKKYKAEIEQGLKNADFGYINASKEYRDYTSAARKKLREIK